QPLVENHEESANVSGINEDLIRRFSIILCTLSCGSIVNVEAFDKYAMETANLYVNLYPWYYMPVSVHKILIHGGKIIEFAILPIGLLNMRTRKDTALRMKNNALTSFFEESANVSGINEDLIRRFSIILCTLSCGSIVNVEAFDKYAMETANLYVNLYPWYYMPVSVHKILIHG
ncbi:hypothetical protein L798_00781, partial [Zootermopsis nevadensis]